MLEINRENVLASLTTEWITWFEICLHFNTWYKDGWGEMDYARYNQLEALLRELWANDEVVRTGDGSNVYYRLPKEIDK